MSANELFHGSKISGIDTLEPRVARNGSFPDRISSPAVYASPDVEIAIFMAIIGSRRWGGWDHRKYPGQGFYVYEEFCDYLTEYSDHNVSGTVYVLDRNTFKLSPYGEWTSESPVTTLGAIAVGVTDLPPLTIIDEPHPYYKFKSSKLVH